MQAYRLVRTKSGIKLFVVVSTYFDLPARLCLCVLVPRDITVCDGRVSYDSVQAKSSVLNGVISWQTMISVFTVLSQVGG